METASSPHSQAGKRAADALKKLPWLSEAQAAVSWAILIVLAGLLGTIYLVQASHIAIVGRRVQAMQAQVDKLKRENDSLETQIANAQSLSKTEERAVQLGFVQALPEDMEFLVVPQFPAEEVATATPEATPSPQRLPQSMREALWQTVKARLSDLVNGESDER